MTQTRGFAITKDQDRALRSHGVAPKSIWLAGRGVESLDRCISTFRGRPGVLIVAHDLRVLGESKKAVADAMAALEKASIQVLDITHPEDTTVAALVQRASVAISGSRFRDRRVARRRGRDGGLAKGQQAVLDRSVVAPDWLVRNIAQARDLPFPVKLRLLDYKFSEATLRRHYGATAAWARK